MIDITEQEWRVEDPKTPIFVVRTIANDPRFGDPIEEFICHVSPDLPEGVESEEALELAQAIAATPKLLKACKALLKTWKDAGPQGSAQFEKFDHAVRLANIAVDKAEGNDQ